MKISNVIVSYNSLKMQVSCKPILGQELISPMYKINFIEYQLKGFITVNNPNITSNNPRITSNNQNIWCLLMKFNKCVNDGLLYTLKVNSTELNIKSKTFISDDSDWRLLGYYSTSTYNFNIEINVGIKTCPYFRLFVDDDSLTDFEIKGTDGSIRVHRIVLAAASDVFRLMITNDFKEKKQAHVDLPYSKCVLKDLKDYLYLNTLNNDNLEDVLLLAHCYMMYELKQDCINRLVFNITTQNSLELLEFAVVNKITELLVPVLKTIQKNEADFENYETRLPICNDDTPTPTDDVADPSVSQRPPTQGPLSLYNTAYALGEPHLFISAASAMPRTLRFYPRSTLRTSWAPPINLREGESQIKA